MGSLDLEELMPRFSPDDDLESQFAELALGIEIAEWALRQNEFAPVGKQIAGGKIYTFRVNGLEYESPHAHVTCRPNFDVRIFLGSDPSGVVADNVASPSFDQQIRNSKTRQLLLDWVRLNHARILRAWVDIGNPIHHQPFELSVMADNPDDLVKRKMRERGATWLEHGPLNAHLEQEYLALHKGASAAPASET
jgi:hypothetical protein